VKLNKPKFLVYPLAFISLFFSCNEQSTLDYTEIPFKLENGRVIVEATVNGKKGRFIFDTGATGSYLDIKAIGLLPRAYTITRYKGRRRFLLVYNLNKITFGDIELKTRSWVMNRSDVITAAKKENYDGLFGNGIFEGYWCELSFSKSKIILYKEKSNYFTCFSPVKILSKYDTEFYIPVIIDGQSFYLNIDTGMPQGIFFPDGLIKTKNPDEYREIVSDGEVKLYHLVKTNLIHILDEAYTGMAVMTNSYMAARRNNDDIYNDLGLLGISFLKYYDFLFDYRDLRTGKSTGLYYEPNTPVEERDYGFFSFMKKPPTLGILNFAIGESGIVIKSIIKDSIVYEICGFRVGTIITKINGKPVAVLSQEEMLDPLFYLAIDNYTILEDGIEHTFPSPFKENLRETSADKPPPQSDARQDGRSARLF
jgi:hypothetical protein